MKRKTGMILLICLAILTAAVFPGCGSFNSDNKIIVTKNYVNYENHIIIEYSDGTVNDLGPVPGNPGSVSPGTADVDVSELISGSYVDENGHLVLVLKSGGNIDLGEIGTEVPHGGEVSVKNIRIDENMHAIAEMSDGTTKDLGYVGVEVTPPKYTVRFVDANGKTISEQSVFKGEDAEAPAAPKIADATFEGWDTDFKNVQQDLTVSPLYSYAETYTVTFKDDKGNTLSVQQVVRGHSATAPTPPSYTNKVFDGWSRSYSNVTSDITVTATYRKKNVYTVTFVDYSGRELGRTSVTEGSSASAPVMPSREGYTFSGWSSSLSNITSNKTVTAQYDFNGGKNVLDISYTLSGNDTVKVTLKVTGTVNFCGIEGTVPIPDSMTFVKFTEADGTTANYLDDENAVLFMFSSNNGKNVTSETTIMTLELKYKTGTSSVTLGVTVADIYDQDYNDVTYKIIGKAIKL